MEVFGVGEQILPNVHSGERLESRHRLLLHNQAIPGLAQPTSGQTKPLQPMAHFLRAKFGSLAPHFHKTVDPRQLFPGRKCVAVPGG
jgi:hypothetical protein